jgi:hypothetical protein
MLDSKKISGIGRPFDPNYPASRAIVAIAVLVGLVGGAVQLFIIGSSLLDSFVWSVEAAGGVFFAWALSRELDPDNEMSAFVSPGLWILSLAVINAPGLLASLWFLWSLRILNRTSGLAAKSLDSILFLALGSWLSFQTSGIYILMMALVFFLDGLLEPSNRQARKEQGGAAPVKPACEEGFCHRLDQRANRVQVCQPIFFLQISSLAASYATSRPSWKSLQAIRKNQVIKSTYPMPVRIAMIFEGAIPTLMSPTNRSMPDSNPIKAVTLLNILARSMIAEITSAAPITVERPAVFVAIKSTIPTMG